MAACKTIQEPGRKENQTNQKTIDKVLSDFFWPPGLKSGIPYRTTHDDNDGDPSNGVLSVAIGPDGDVWMQIYGHVPLRFRVPLIGGGKYPKIRNALLLLAEAIRQEGEQPGGNDADGKDQKDGTPRQAQ